MQIYIIPNLCLYIYINAFKNLGMSFSSPQKIIVLVFVLMTPPTLSSGYSKLKKVVSDILSIGAPVGSRTLNSALRKPYVNPLTPLGHCICHHNLN